MAKNSREQIELDEKKLLSELVKNSNENIDTIAKHCGFSRQKAWRLIKQLEAKKLIWGYTAVFDDEKIGLNHFIVMMKRTSKPLKEEITDQIISRRIENMLEKFGGTIESSYYVHGDYDWIVTLTAKNINQAKKYIDIMLSLHPNEIEKVTIMQTLMFIRKQYILNPDRKKLKDFL
jgi:DNA-binding Lrp family transcriptional regulator